jgi:oxaloacetate decarboxylase gamma subunit
MENLVGESLKFMVLGMGIVFVLLAFIVLLTNIQAKIVAKFFPDKSNSEVRPVKSAAAKSASSDGAVIAAISAAISHYKKN